MVKDIYNSGILNENLSAVIELSYDGIFITDNEANVLYMNKAYESISELRREKIIGHNMRELEDQGLISISSSLRVISELKVVTVNQTFNNGKKVLVTSTPIFDRENNLILVVTNVRDISELVKLEQEIEENKKITSLYKSELKELKLKLESNKFIIAQDKVMMETLDRALRIARVDSTVLILGKTGVGKEVVANMIWKNGEREEKPFIRVNCAGIPENLIEIELFGYEEISISEGTVDGKPGYFEMANGGTIFLDEIGELPFKIQSRLLKVLQDGSIMRVGSSEEAKVDVRIIAATNRNLEKMVAEGLFREDLYYRINVIPIVVPDLSKRKDDIVFLTKKFLKLFNEKYNRNKVIDNSVVEVFNKYTWPGNVRQLKNTVERMVVLSNNDLITTYDIPENIMDEVEHCAVRISGNLTLKEAVQKLEDQMIKSACNRCGNAKEAADELGINTSTLERKIKNSCMK